MPPLILLLWIIAAVILFIIIREGAREDVMTRYITSIDRFKWAFFATSAIPFVWFGIEMFSSGFGFVYVLNIAILIVFWISGLLNIIGGADAYVIMLCGVLFPFVFPACVCFGLSAFVVRFCRNAANAEDWELRGVPYFVPLRWGYVLTIPLAVLFASLFF